MADTIETYTVQSGHTSSTAYNFTFPIIEDTDVKVKVNGALKTKDTQYTVTTSAPTHVKFNGTANYTPAQDDEILIFRSTDDDINNNLFTTFGSGSTLRAAELNDNFKRLLYIGQEIEGQSMSTTGDTMVGNLDMGAGTSIVFEGATEDAHQTTLNVVDPTADRTINLPNEGGQVLLTSNVTHADLGSRNIYTTGHIDIADNSQIKIGTGDDFVLKHDGTDSSITNATGDLNITCTGDDVNITAADDIYLKVQGSESGVEIFGNDGVKLYHDANERLHAHDTGVNITGTAGTGSSVQGDFRFKEAGSTTTRVLWDESAGEVRFTDDYKATFGNGSDLEIYHNGTNSFITNTTGSLVIRSKSNHYGLLIKPDAEVDIYYANVRKLSTKTDGIQVVGKVDATTLTGDGSGLTALTYTNITGLNTSLAQLNTLNGKTIDDGTFDGTSNTEVPTSKSINDHFSALLSGMGGYVPVDTRITFPTAHPDPDGNAGTLLCIADAGGIVVNGSNTATNCRKTGSGSDDVTITDFDGAFTSSTIASGLAIVVQTTGTAHTYKFHHALVKDATVASLQDDINQFNNRYRIVSTNPTSNNDEGDLIWRTSDDKMLVYNGSAFEEISAIGEHDICTISTFSGTGGNSATFNGTAYKFTLSHPPSSGAEQLLVSVNGVIQKPNSGTSQPAEGFAVDGSAILFGAAPPTGSNYFIVRQGNAVDIGAPSNGTVTPTKLSTGGPHWDTNSRLIVGHNASTGQDRALQIVGTTSDTASVELIKHSADGAASLLDFSKSRNATKGSNTIVQDDDTLGSIIFRGDDGTDLTSIAASIVSKVDGTPGANDMPGRIEFRTTPDGSNNSTARMLIDSSGNVGIATTSAGEKLDVAGNIRVKSSGVYKSSHAGSASAPVYSVGDADTGMYRGANANELAFSTAGTQRVLIDASGNVGIGTDDPQKPLNIVGAGTELIRLSQAVDASTQQEFGIGWAANNTAHTHPGAKITSKEYDISDTRASLLFYTRGTNQDVAATERMRITEVGRVGIGTSGPTQTLHLLNSADTALYIANSDTSASGKSWIQFGPSNNVTGSQIICQAEEDFSSNANRTAHLQFLTRKDGNLLEKVRIQAAGGISFNGDTAAANALDDYEEGTWTVQLTGSTSGTSNDGNSGTGFDTASGVYTKVGNTVHYTMHLANVHDGDCAGDLRFSLPFTAGNGQSSTTSLRTVGAAVLSGVNYTAVGQANSYIESGDAFCRIAETIDNTSLDWLDTGNVDSDGNDIFMSGTYFTDS